MYPMLRSIYNLVMQLEMYQAICQFYAIEIILYQKEYK